MPSIASGGAGARARPSPRARSAACASPAEYRLTITVSVSAAATTACFQLSCTGDSAAVSIRVPICAPSAPSANAAAIETPSAIPPAATIGTSTFAAISGSSTIDDAPSGVLEAAAFDALDHEPVDSGGDRLDARRAASGTTWKTVIPASLSCGTSFAGSPADVVTKRTPLSTMKSTIDRSRTNSWATFTPQGRSVRSRIFAISTRTSSSWPDDVSMIPMPPAFETADASCARAIKPIGAWMIGISMPSMLGHTRLHGPPSAGSDPGAS